MAGMQDEFQERLVTVLTDLQTTKREDGEAMFHLGNLASRLVEDAGAQSWTGVKTGLSPEAFSSLLRTMQTQGNALHKQGRDKAAYAIEVLAVSLIARTLSSPEIAEGDEILDELIETAITTFRQNKDRSPAAGR